MRSDGEASLSNMTWVVLSNHIFVQNDMKTQSFHIIRKDCQEEKFHESKAEKVDLLYFQSHLESICKI